jgi:hypothetical protein
MKPLLKEDLSMTRNEIKRLAYEALEPLMDELKQPVEEPYIEVVSDYLSVPAHPIRWACPGRQGKFYVCLIHAQDVLDYFGNLKMMKALTV